MTNLKANTLLREIPGNLLLDKKVEHMAKALQKSLDEMLDWTEKINYRTNLDSLPDEIIEHLLWESHIEYREGLALATTREQKIKLIENSIELHRLKGTPSAIEFVLRLVDLKGEVLEWWQYDADPYHFIVELALTKHVRHIDDVREMVMEFKNVRSWFDGFVMLMGDEVLHHIDQTYDYPVYYLYCNEVHGTAEMTLFINTLMHIDQTYDYAVEYPVNEAFVTTTYNNNYFIDDSYTYIVEYGTCGVMETLDCILTSVNLTQMLEPDHYDYPVELMVNEAFVTITKDDNVIADNGYTYDIEYGTCGVMETLDCILTSVNLAQMLEPDTYDYPVELMMNEAFVTIAEDDNQITDNGYTYDINFPTCGEIETLESTLSMARSSQNIKFTDYNYFTRWLMCGEFECGEELI